MILNRAGLVFVLSISAAGCVTYSPDRYNVSLSSQASLKKWKGSVVGVGKFSNEQGDKTSFICRDVGLIKLKNEQTFAAYIQDALITELKGAGLYSDSSNRVITGVVNLIDYNSDAEDWGTSISTAAWEISLTLTSNAGGSLMVSDQFKFSTNWNARTACDQSARAFMPAVQHLMHKVVSSNEFAGLME